MASVQLCSCQVSHMQRAPPASCKPQWGTMVQLLSAVNSPAKVQCKLMPPAPALATMLPPPRSRPTIMPCGHLTRRRRGGRDKWLLQGVVRSMQIIARSLCPEVPCCVHGPDLCWCRQVQQVDHRSHRHYLETQVPTGPLAAGC